MIKSFADKTTRLIYQLEVVGGLPVDIQQRALRKLRMLAAATVLRDMTIPRGNQLEALQGDRLGQHSVRINRQWRLCFRWEDGHAHDVEIVDYH